MVNTNFVVKDPTFNVQFVNDLFAEIILENQSALIVLQTIEEE